MLRQIFFICSLTCIAIFSTAQPLRLKAKTYYKYYNGSFQQTDTFIHTYSGDRTLTDTVGYREDVGMERYTRWAADEVFHQKRSVSTPYIDYARITQEFDTDDRLTVAHYFLATMTSMDPSYDRFYHYNADNKVDTFTWDIYDNGSWDHLNKRYCSFSQDGIDTLWDDVWNTTQNQYNPYGYLVYEYTSGQLTGIYHYTPSWTPANRTNYAYTGDNITTCTRGYHNGTNWVFQDKYDYTYDVNDNQVEEILSVWDQINNTGWNLAGKWSRTYDNNHNRVTDTGLSWYSNQWNNAVVYTFGYNSDNLIEWEQKMSWNDTIGQFAFKHNWDTRYLYYYEQYVDPASASNETKNNSALQVYPNPASNTINISLLTAQDKPFSITIFDATGKSVKHWNEPPTTLYQKQVDVSDLPSGSYFLRIDNMPHEAVRFTIVR